MGVYISRTILSLTWLIILFFSQTAVSAVCHKWFADDEIVHITGYDIALRTRDPLGPFHIETHVRKVGLLLGMSHTVMPQNVHAYVLDQNSTSRKQTTANEIVLRIGVPVETKFLPPVTEKAISVIAKEYGKIWAELNLPEASPATKEFLSDLVTAIYSGDLRFVENVSPELRNFWRFHFEKMRSSSEYRRTLIPKVLKILQETDNPADTTH